MNSNLFSQLTLIFCLLFIVAYSQVNKSKNNLTDVVIINSSEKDSVQVFLTLQYPNSVIGLFGIKESDTIGSKSQGFFYAKRKTKYFLESKGELFGINISFDSPPLSCEQAVLNGFSSGMNIFEASINCDYESFDISCVNGAKNIMSKGIALVRQREALACA